MKTIVLRILATIFIMVNVSSAATVFAYTSSPEAWVGHGKTEVHQEPQYKFIISTTSIDNGLHVDVINSAKNWFEFSYWDLDFTAFASKRFEAGKIYEGTHPIGIIPIGKSLMEFYGSGRANNTLSGFFQVHEVEYTGNTITKIALDFTQYDERNVQKWNKGEIRINSDFPITIPEPTIFGLLTLFSLAFARRKR